MNYAGRPFGDPPKWPPHFSLVENFSSCQRGGNVLKQPFFVLRDGTSLPLAESDHSESITPTSESVTLHSPTGGEG